MNFPRFEPRHGDFPQQLGLLELRLQNLLLIAHAVSIAGLRRLLDLPQQLAVLCEDGLPFRQIAQLEVSHFEFCHDGSAKGFDFLLSYLDIFLRNFAAQPQFPGVRKVLRNAKADVGEIAIGVARKRPRAAHADVLQNKLRVGQRGHLSGDLLCRIPLVSGRLDLRIISLGLRDQVVEVHGLIGGRRFLRS